PAAGHHRTDHDRRKDARPRLRIRARRRSRAAQGRGVRTAHVRDPGGGSPLPLARGPHARGRRCDRGRDPWARRRGRHARGRRRARARRASGAFRDRSCRYRASRRDRRAARAPDLFLSRRSAARRTRCVPGRADRDRRPEPRDARPRQAQRPPSDRGPRDRGCAEHAGGDGGRTGPLDRHRAQEDPRRVSLAGPDDRARIPAARRRRREAEGTGHRGARGGRGEGMSDQVLLTTTVGSFGKPDYLQKARNANARGKLGEAALALAEVVRQEAEDLQAAGARYIQIDEPAIHARPEEIDIAIEAMGVVTQNLTAKTISHICYGDFAAIYPKVLELPVDQLDLAMANYGYRWLDLFDRDRFTKELAIGIVDVHAHTTETVDEAAEGIRKGLRYVRAEKLWPHPDCGLKTRTVEESVEKCVAVIEATK